MKRSLKKIIEEKSAVEERLEKLSSELRKLNEELKLLKSKLALGENCRDALMTCKSRFEELQDSLEGLEKIKTDLEEKISNLLRKEAEKILAQKQKAFFKALEELEKFENETWQEFKKTYAKLEILSAALGKGDPVDFIQTCRMLPKSQKHYLPRMSQTFWEQQVPKEEWPPKFKTNYEQEIQELSYEVERGLEEILQDLKDQYGLSDL